MTFAIIDETHAPTLESWVESANGHDQFPIQNLPFGIFSPSTAADDPRPGVAIGDRILDLRLLASMGMLAEELKPSLSQATLNTLFALPAPVRFKLRKSLSAMLSDASQKARLEPALHDADACLMRLPAAIGDYTDFYVGIHHATNVGKLFRPENPLLPNYKYVPIGYHGRSSSVRLSGEQVVRPVGQTKNPADDLPVVASSRRLDYEMELGIWIGEGNPLGQPIPIAEAGRHIVGFCLLNDWSARDLQAWEYQPLGPFLAKNFHTTISPWVVTSEALAPFRKAQPKRPDGDPAPLPYLRDEQDQQLGALAIDLDLHLLTAKMRAAGAAPYRLSQGAAHHMYWTVNQIVTHHASNGCNLQPGDLIGTGTISAPTKEGYGSLLEISEGGKTPLQLPNGEVRSFVEDGDEIIYAAAARKDGFVSIGFGKCRATVTQAGR
jgi:fumarylacetoacetase